MRLDFIHHTQTAHSSGIKAIAFGSSDPNPLTASTTTSTDRVELQQFTEMEGQYVGTAKGIVINKQTQKPVDVVITTMPTRKNDFGTDFIAYLPIGQDRFQELGHISIHESTCDTGPCMRFDTIDTRKGHQQYRHIGHMLQQLAVEVAIKLGHNHITGSSSPSYGIGDPISFHYKGGFVTYSNTLNQRLEKAHKANQRESLGLTEIFMSPQGWQDWQSKIEANPILTHYDPLGELKASDPVGWLEAIYDITLRRGVRLSSDVIQAAKTLAGQLKLRRYDPDDLDNPS